MLEHLSLHQGERTSRCTLPLGHGTRRTHSHAAAHVQTHTSADLVRSQLKIIKQNRENAHCTEGIYNRDFSNFNGVTECLLWCTV